MNIYIITAKDKQTALYAYDSAEKKCRLYRNGSLSAVISMDGTEEVPPEKINRWITIHNARVPVEKGKNNKEAGKEFIEKHEENKSENLETMTAAGRPRKQKWLDRTKRRIELFQDIFKNLPEEAQNKINEIKIKQHSDNILPSFTESFRQQHGLKNIPIKLKQNILERNNLKHDVIDPREYQMLLGLGLYAPMFFAPGHKPGYLNMISMLENDDYPVVLVQLLEEDGYYIIVHFYFLDEKDRKGLLGIP